jgi:hypothetical protein
LLPGSFIVVDFAGQISEDRIGIKADLNVLAARSLNSGRRLGQTGIAPDGHLLQLGQRYACRRSLIAGWLRALLRYAYNRQRGDQSMGYGYDLGVISVKPHRIRRLCLLGRAKAGRQHNQGCKNQPLCSHLHNPYLFPIQETARGGLCNLRHVK